MDGFGSFVHKNSALRRWFVKQKPATGKNENFASDHQSEASTGTLGQVANHEESSKLSNDNLGESQLGGTHDTAPQSRHDAARLAEQEQGDDGALLNDAGGLKQEAWANGEGPGETELQQGGLISIGEADVEDYTQNGGGIVCGFDGTKSCPALLLTYDWSMSTQNMIRYQRVVLKEEQEARAKLEALSRYEDALAREVRHHESLIAVLCDGNATGMEGSEDEPNRLENLQYELENLDRLSKGAQAKRINIESSVEDRRNFLREYQTEVTQYLEEAFVYAQAIEPASDEEAPEVPEYSLQEEYQTLVRQMQELHGGPMTEAHLELATADENLPTNSPVLDPQKQAQTDASRALWEAKENLQYARVQFEDKDRLRNQDFQQNVQAEQRGEPTADLSIEDFDLRWVVRFREITRNVLDAEREVTQARAAAKKVGLRLEYDDQSSCFPDDAADGSPELMSSDIDSPEVFAGDSRMIAWMESLADAADPEFFEPIEVDEWGSGEELDANDSASVVGEFVARDSKRRRIDAWQRACRIDDV